MKINSLLAGIFVFGCLSNVEAAYFTIANGDNTALINAIITSAQNNETDTIELANNGIYQFASGPYNYFEDNNTDYKQNALPEITDDVSGLDLVILGNNASFTRTGAAFYRFLFIRPDSEVTISNLTFENGNIESVGGAILVNTRSVIRLTNVQFTNCRSFSNDPYTGGGGIWLRSYCTGFFDQCTFSNNENMALGAVLCNLEITNSLFENNVHLYTGNPSGGGGAIYWDGTDNRFGQRGWVNVDNCVFTNNTTKCQGGAIFNQVYENADVHITRSTFYNNRSTSSLAFNEGMGGAIFNSNGPSDLSSTVVIDNSLFKENRAEQQGGAIWIQNNLNVTIENNTLVGNIAQSGNSSNGLGGGIMLAGSSAVLVKNCTIANNQAGSEGGAIRAGTTLTLTNSIISNNEAFNQYDNKKQCADGNGFVSNPNGYFTDGGNNIEFPVISNTFNNGYCVSNSLHADPLLDILADNGGPTETIALLPSSPAIDATANCSPSDQRGATRNGTCDIGAYEYQGFLNVEIPLVEIAVEVFPNPSDNNQFKVNLPSLFDEETVPFSLIDANGRTVMSGKIKSGDSIDALFILPGVYHLVLNTTFGVCFSKVILL